MTLCLLSLQYSITPNVCTKHSHNCPPSLTVVDFNQAQCANGGSSLGNCANGLCPATYACQTTNNVCCPSSTGWILYVFSETHRITTIINHFKLSCLSFITRITAIIMRPPSFCSSPHKFRRQWAMRQRRGASRPVHQRPVRCRIRVLEQCMLLAGGNWYVWLRRFSAAYT